ASRAPGPARDRRVAGARRRVLRRASGAEPALRRDVLIQPEEVARVVAALDVDEPIVRLSWVCGMDPLRAVAREEVHVRAAVALTQRAADARDPRALLGSLARVRVEDAEIDHDLRAAVRERGRV